MKIAIISSYPPQKEGVGNYTEQLVRSIEKTSFDKKIDLKIHILTFKNKLFQNNPYVHRVITSNIFKINSLYSTLKQIKPDIIHVQYATPIYKLYSIPLWIQLYIYRKYYNSKVVVTFHEVNRDIQRMGIIGKIYYQIICSGFDRLFVHTEEAKNTLDGICKNRNNIISIPLGHYDYKFTKNEPSLSRYKNIDVKNKNLILYFGYIHIDKGIHHLLDACNIIYSQYPSFRKNSIAIIAGSVRPREGIFKIFEFIDYLYLKLLIYTRNKYDLQQLVYFTGYTDPKYISRLFNKSSVVMLPYTKVEQSSVLSIAIKANKPIIASNIGGLRETLRETGILIPPGNHREMARQIIKVITNKKYSSSIVRGYTKINKNNLMSNTSKVYIKNYYELLNQKYIQI